MKTEYQLYLDYRRAKGAVAELRAIARDARRTADQEFSTALKSVGQSWDGESAEEFVSKGRKLRDKMYQEAANIERIATTAESMAQATYQAEMRAVRIARERAKKSS